MALARATRYSGRLRHRSIGAVVSARRGFSSACSLCTPSMLPVELRESKSWDFDVAAFGSQLQPQRDGGFLKAVGLGDRGSGLTYRAPGGQTGRLAPTVAEGGIAMPPPSADPDTSVWLLKVQAPLDTSSDGAGGIGRMTPDTLLLHDSSLSFCLFIAEEERGHTALLRAALRNRSQVAYLYAEQPQGSPGTLRVYTDVLPDQTDVVLDW
jgi:hypothetical protein